MVKIRQNPLLLWSALALIAVGVLLSYTTSISTILYSGFLFIGTLLGFSGTELWISSESLKIGFTKLSADEIQHIDLSSEERVIEITARNSKCYSLRRWHYHSADWLLAQDRLKSLANKLKL